MYRRPDDGRRVGLYVSMQRRPFSHSGTEVMAIKIKRRKPEAPEGPVAESTEPVEGEESLAGSGLAPGQLPVPLLAEDPVYTRTWSFFTWMEANRTAVLSGIGGVLVLLAVFGLISKSRSAAAEESSQRLFAALDMAAASSVAEGSMLQRETAIAASAGVVATSEGGQIGGLAGLLLGRASLMSGDAAAALAAYDSGATALQAPESGFVAVARAAAQASSGDLAGSLAALEAVAASDSGAAYAARRQAALLTDTWGEPRAALEAWRNVVSEHAGAPGIDTATNRVAQLEIALGVAPVAAEGSADGATDAQSPVEDAP